MPSLSVLVTLCLFSLVQHSVSFTTNPISQTQPENATASFSCVSSVNFPDQVAWSVYFPDLKKFFVSQDNLHLQEFERRGIFFLYNDTANFMNISAVKFNNGTTVRCREYDVLIGSRFSEEATLTVVGPPLPPGVRMSLMSATEIFLEWEEPFTSQEYPILNYTVVESEIGSGQSRKFTSHTFNHVYSVPNIATKCKEIEFVVVATNAVGDSDPTTIVAGLPIVPANGFKIEVLNRGNSSSDISISVTPPPVCVYQQAQLFLTILHQQSNSIMQVREINYTGIANTLQFHLKERLVPDNDYTLVTMVTTAAGNVTAQYQFTTPSTVSVTTSSYTDMKSLLDNNKSQLVLICSIVGGVVGVTLIVIVLALVVLVVMRKLRSSSK